MLDRLATRRTAPPAVGLLKSDKPLDALDLILVEQRLPKQIKQVFRTFYRKISSSFDQALTCSCDPPKALRDESIDQTAFIAEIIAHSANVALARLDCDLAQ